MQEPSASSTGRKKKGSFSSGLGKYFKSPKGREDGNEGSGRGKRESRGESLSSGESRSHSPHSRADIGTSANVYESASSSHFSSLISTEDLGAIREEEPTSHSYQFLTTSRREDTDGSDSAENQDRSAQKAKRSYRGSTDSSPDVVVIVPRKPTYNCEELIAEVKSKEVWDLPKVTTTVYRIAFRLSEARKVPVSHGVFFIVKLKSDDNPGKCLFISPYVLRDSRRVGNLS